MTVNNVEMTIIKVPSRDKNFLLTNPQQIRVIRYAVGMTIAAALAFGIAWPLSFLFPVLSAVLLALPLPKLSLSQGMRNMRDTLFAFGVGYIFTMFILPFPVIYVPLLALALFHTYYHLNRGGSFWLVLMLLICLLLMPMLAGLHEGLAIGVVSGLVGSSWLTIGLLWLAHYIVPDAPGGPVMPQDAKKAPGYKPGYSAPAAAFALKSTIVALPIAIVFIANNWSSQILVMVFAAIFTLSPNLDKGKEAGSKFDQVNADWRWCCLFCLLGTGRGTGISLFSFTHIFGKPWFC